MKYKVNILKSAEDDLLEIYKYIYINDCEENADKIYAKIVEKVSSLQELPNRGHIPSELSLLGMEDFLAINNNPFTIIYQIIEKTVFFHCVLNSRKDMHKLLQERLVRE